MVIPCGEYALKIVGIKARDRYKITCSFQLLFKMLEFKIIEIWVKYFQRLKQQKLFDFLNKYENS